MRKFEYTKHFLQVGARDTVTFCMCPSHLSVWDPWQDSFFVEHATASLVVLNTLLQPKFPALSTHKNHSLVDPCWKWMQTLKIFAANTIFYYPFLQSNGIKFGYAFLTFWPWRISDWQLSGVYIIAGEILIDTKNWRKTYNVPININARNFALFHCLPRKLFLFTSWLASVTLPKIVVIMCLLKHVCTVGMGSKLDKFENFFYSEVYFQIFPYFCPIHRFEG